MTGLKNLPLSTENDDVLALNHRSNLGLVVSSLHRIGQQLKGGEISINITLNNSNVVLDVSEGTTCDQL